jgi:hypothetical protein
MATRKQQEQDQDQQSYSIKAAADYLGVSVNRVRTLIRQGKLSVIEKTMLGVAGVTVKVITRDALDAYQREAGARKSGSRAYVVKLTPEQVEQVKALGIDLEPRYQPKRRDQAEATAETE